MQDGVRGVITNTNWNPRIPVGLADAVAVVEAVTIAVTVAMVVITAAMAVKSSGSAA